MGGVGGGVCMSEREREGEHVSELAGSFVLRVFIWFTKAGILKEA